MPSCSASAALVLAALARPAPAKAAAARSKLPSQPTRSIQVRQWPMVVSAFTCCLCCQMPPVMVISSGPSGRQTEVDGRTGPPCLADDIKNLCSFCDEDGDAVEGDGN